MTALLQVKGVTRTFGGYTALGDVSCEVATGQVHALIGPNGAGKTTLFNVISGMLRPTAGRVVYQGRDYTGSRADQVLAMGVARNFQQVRLFPGLSIVENVMIGCHARMGGLLRDLANLVSPRAASEIAARERAVAMLQLVGMGERLRGAPTELTLVDQRRLEIARALASAPQLLLLDEPAAGMNPAETNDLAGLVRKITTLGITVLLVEHHMRFVMAIADMITVLSAGRIIAQGPPDAIQKDQGVIAAYLGGAAS
jgi:branched-chain amino acid transport system ATP-binding protein